MFNPNDSIMESSGGPETDRLKPQPFKRDITPQIESIEPPKSTRFKRLKQGEPYTLLASDEKSMRMSKMDYQTMKEE